jgi:hypothetical protein
MKVPEEVARTANLDGVESSFEFALATRDKNDVCTLTRELGSCAETQSFGSAGDKNCLEKLLAMLLCRHAS